MLYSTPMEPSAAFELQDIVGVEAMRELCRRFGGTRIYVPIRPPSLHAVIVADFGEELPQAASVMSAYRHVADRHGVSVATVRRLVS